MRIGMACLMGVLGLAAATGGVVPTLSAPAIRNLERLNTAANEDDPCLCPDGNQLVYASDAAGKYALLLASRKGPGFPLEPDRTLDELSAAGQVRGACLLPRTADGWEYLYFSTQMQTDAKKPNFDIYRVGRFNERRPFQGNNAASPVQAVCTDADEAFPWLSPDARELHFSRKTEKGWQLMRAVGKEPRVFTQVETLAVSTGFYHACLNRAGTKMIVQGPLQPEETRQGLFLVKRKSTKATWEEPIPLTSINSTEGTLGTCSPSLSIDTHYLYFASDRPGGKGGLDLYVVAVAEVAELK
jgi:hypothetical protein